MDNILKKQAKRKLNPQKINNRVTELGNKHSDGDDVKKVRLMFQDEAGFGRINKPKQCWCPQGTRPTVPCHHIREYRYAYGAVEPVTGESFFLVMPYCNTDCMNIFLEKLSVEYADDVILLVVDGASWHRANWLKVPPNIELFFLPPYTPEMNPIEQIWKELRKRGFCNELFNSLEDVVCRLCEVIKNLLPSDVKSITCRGWISGIFS